MISTKIKAHLASRNYTTLSKGPQIICAIKLHELYQKFIPCLPKLANYISAVYTIKSFLTFIVMSLLFIVIPLLLVIINPLLQQVKAVKLPWNYIFP